jgi:hypothetical protein
MALRPVPLVVITVVVFVVVVAAAGEAGVGEQKEFSLLTDCDFVAGDGQLPLDCLNFALVHLSAAVVVGQLRPVEAIGAQFSALVPFGRWYVWALLSFGNVAFVVRLPYSFAVDIA